MMPGVSGTRIWGFPAERTGVGFSMTPPAGAVARAELFWVPGVPTRGVSFWGGLDKGAAVGVSVFAEATILLLDDTKTEEFEDSCVVVFEFPGSTEPPVIWDEIWFNWDAMFFEISGMASEKTFLGASTGGKRLLGTDEDKRSVGFSGGNAAKGELVEFGFSWLRPIKEVNAACVTPDCRSI